MYLYYYFHKQLHQNNEFLQHYTFKKLRRNYKEQFKECIFMRHFSADNADGRKLSLGRCGDESDAVIAEVMS